MPCTPQSETVGNGTTLTVLAYGLRLVTRGEIQLMLVVAMVIPGFGEG